MNKLFLTPLIIVATSGILLKGPDSKILEFKGMENANKIAHEVSLENPDEVKNEISAE